MFDDSCAHYDIEIGGYKLVMTCYACPEQYDVFDSKGNQVAYLRLRHGVFRAECPDVFGEQVYRSNPVGDGIFKDDERMSELTAAIQKVDGWVKRKETEQ
jgi:hypothetical protein